MGNTLAVWCVILGGVMVLAPVLFIVLALTMPGGGDWERHTVRVILTALLAVVFHVWFTAPGLFTVGSLLLAYGVAALAHASRSATLTALGIALLCSILVWGWYLYVQILRRRRERRNASDSG